MLLSPENSLVLAAAYLPCTDVIFLHCLSVYPMFWHLSFLGVCLVAHRNRHGAAFMVFLFGLLCHAHKTTSADRIDCRPPVLLLLLLCWLL